MRDVEVLVGSRSDSLGVSSGDFLVDVSLVTDELVVSEERVDRMVVVS